MTVSVSWWNKFFQEKRRWWKFMLVLFVFFMILSASSMMWQDAERRYETLLSPVTYDRNRVPVSVMQNAKGHYVLEIFELPADFTDLLLKKEDTYFQYHPGINPVSTVRAFFNYVIDGQSGGASTITQQLAKNLLGTEIERNFGNKLLELLYALSIEVFATKEEILLMYANSVYLGNQVQGFETASYAYFSKPLEDTTHSEKISLLTTLSYPSSRNPWVIDDIEYAVQLNDRIASNEIFISPETTESYSFQQDTSFELRTSGIICAETCLTTVDDAVTRSLRGILDRHIQAGWNRNVRNGAVVVIDAKTAELLAMVGSRDPKSDTAGNQINMAIRPRPIGSTIKPFIYAKGFELGLRPYSIVEDREYKYPIATGFSLYPKNYDGQYRGAVTLHEALSNSLNVPSVKTLEYIGLKNFYAFLSDDLKFEPLQDYDSYQYGIALGGLEMDLLTLTHYFTLFPRDGSIAPLKVLKASSTNFNLPPQSHIEREEEVLSEEFIELVHIIISDRLTGVNQFGLEGNLNLTQDNYAVKTGTSRDYHDSWVVGYTGDFVVGVWLGNTENKPLDQVSGSSGAGAVWHDVMEYLFSTPYNKKTRLETDTVRRIFIAGSDEWGLANDNVLEHQDLLQDDKLIVSVHGGDVFEIANNLVIPLRARKPVRWSVNGQDYGITNDTVFLPSTAGVYEIAAYDAERDKREIVTVEVVTLE